VKSEMETQKVKQYLIISIVDQKLDLFEDGNISCSYDISTSKYGIGNAQNSNMTPLGMHRIVEKIGDGVPAGGIFSGRKYSSKLYSDQENENENLITSRIIILEGLEPGFNKGSGIDSLKRGIWMHGTNEEDKIGSAASHGCIRMRNKEIIDLYDKIEVGAMVEIVK